MYTPANVKRVQYKKYTADQLEYIHTAVTNGQSVATIAKAINTTPVSIFNALRRRRIGVRGVREIHTLTLNQLSDAMDISHESLLFIARILKISNHRKRGHYHLTIDQITAFLQDQRLWWRWHPQRITIDWLRDLATEIRSKPVTGRWLPTTEAIKFYNTSWGTICRRIKRGEYTACFFGGKRLVWCPTEK